MKDKIKFPYFLRVLSFALIAGFFISQNPALAQVSPPNSGAGVNSSYNWAGYVASGGGYTSVSGSWIIPQIPASSGFTADATWIGIGGVSSSDLIQTGTQAITSGGTTAYQAWYEILPAVSQPISITVNPGDSITASVVESAANQWTISLRDNSNGQNFQTVSPYSSSGLSAEWIEEMPSQSNGAFIPLDNFDSLQFSGSAATRNGQNLTAGQLGALSMNMVNIQQQILAAPSQFNSDGASFTVTRTSAVTSASGITPFGRRGYGRVGVGIRGFGPIPGQNQRPKGFSRLRLRLFTQMSGRR